MARLSAMMFLQYGPLGVWGVTVSTFIAANTGSEGEGIFSSGFAGYSTATGAIGGLVAPVVFGVLSDRLFAAQKIVAVMNAACAVTLLGMHQARGEVSFFVWLLLYWHCFVPAATLTNKICLVHLAENARAYPRIRVFATVGWIAAGLFVGYFWRLVTGESIEATRTPLLIGAVGSAIVAAYSLTLPHTPPEAADSDRRTTWREALALLSNRRLVGFLLVASVACVPSTAYNNFANLFLNHAGYPRPAAIMTIGQVSDIACLLALPWFLGRLGLRTVFGLGIACWTTRYFLLAAGAAWGVAWPVYASIAIHGPCFVFVYIVAVMLVDEVADPTQRGAAQGLLSFASGGVGHLIGAAAVGLSQSAFLTPPGVSPPPFDWVRFWSVPAAIGVLGVTLFVWLCPRVDQAAGDDAAADGVTRR